VITPSNSGTTVTAFARSGSPVSILKIFLRGASFLEGRKIVPSGPKEAPWTQSSKRAILFHAPPGGRNQNSYSPPSPWLTSASR